MVSGDDGGNKEPCTREYLENSEMGVFGVPFFLSGFSFKNIHDSQNGRRWGRVTPLTPFSDFHPLHRHLDIIQLVAAESSPLYIASNRDRTGNL